jgi:hypothetical protein
VFWADIALHTICSAPASGAGPVTTLWGPASAIGPDIVLIDPVLYFADGSPGQVMSMNKAGTAAQSFAAVQARSLAADVSAVYFTTQGGDVVRAPAGSASAPIATAQTQPTAVAVNATHACWVSGAAGSKVVACALLTGGAVTTMQASAIAIAMDDQLVYWAINPAPGTIEKARLDGTGRTTLATNQPFPFDIGVDATTVFWTSETQRSVFAVPK